MKPKQQMILSLCLIAAFALWTAAVSLVDVQAIGPDASTVGFAALNSAFHRLTGVHMSLYLLTDWLSLVPVGFVMGFAGLGLVQWIARRHLSRVDLSLFVLGGFYIAVMAVYVLFEFWVINHRPVWIDGVLEASYPSSTTLLVLCVMPTSILQLRSRIHNLLCRRCITLVLSAFTLFMAMGRLISGVHWLSDIIGSVLLSAGLVLMYHSAARGSVLSSASE